MKILFYLDVAVSCSFSCSNSKENITVTSYQTFFMGTSALIFYAKMSKDFFQLFIHCQIKGHKLRAIKWSACWYVDTSLCFKLLQQFSSHLSDFSMLSYIL